ncbi:hypothetical protein DBR39_13610 [Chryseobacterium sp. KBW03]|uniref:hypothetical protein n=1 Tax=Chryseobacterium sp. KBW03 TaxID=2153362 RepID=UPI000F5AAB01|nr:hypothetical protein [Chryseobacterium sp. KBW03]RQO37920.1 hypothetical protein DBR39_13610 [Chryseobacterium sp. KBW03]
MDKPTKKRIKYNEDILNVLRSRYGYTFDFIRKSLRGDRVGEMPDQLIKEYKELDNALKKRLEEKMETLNPASYENNSKISSSNY